MHVIKNKNMHIEVQSRGFCTRFIDMLQDPTQYNYFMMVGHIKNITKSRAVHQTIKSNQEEEEGKHIEQIYSTGIKENNKSRRKKN